MSLTDSEIEVQLEKVVLLFGYIVDKDLFGEIYRQQLAKRLLNQKRYACYTMVSGRWNDRIMCAL